MPKDELIYVGHMLDMSQKAVEALKGKTRPLYDKDEFLRLALAHLIQTIGEAGSNVSESFRNKTPNIPWKKIIGMRHKVVHDYMYVDYDIVWDVVTVELPALISELQKIVGH
jgi:uncharacterized protein with HEPN domain